MSVLGKPVVRAAVYTRKSSDEGLDGAVRQTSPSISILVKATSTRSLRTATR